jgi:microcystin-dependent protein
MCNGQLLPISQNTALFSLLGTFYGGDGRSNFALPNLQGCAPIHTGGNQPGPGLSNYSLGETGGNNTVTLLETEIPAHSHTLMASSQQGTDAAPGGENLARSVGASLYQSTTNTNLVAMAPSALVPSGGSLPHNNLMPYLTLNFCIALQGVFPARN